MAKTKSRRLRKKLHVGEYTELGFAVTFLYKNPLQDDEIVQFLDLFISSVIESNGLIYGGSCGNSFDGFVALEKRGSVTEEQRQKVKSWLESNSNLTGIEVGALTNAWY